MWLYSLVFCDCGFQSVCPLMEKDKGLMKASWWERLTEGETLCLIMMGRAMLSKSLIQFSVDGWSCVLSLLFIWGQTMVEVMKIMVMPFRRSHAGPAALSALRPVAGHHWPTPLPETLAHPQASPDTHCQSGPVSCVVTVPFSWDLVHTGFCLCPPEVCFPVLCEFWQLYGGLMAISSETAFATPWSTASRVPATAAVHCWPGPPQEMLSPCGVSGSWCTQGLLEPSEHLWRVCGLI